MATVRIIGGACRSRRIAVPRNVRPTLDRVRESLFNRLGQSLEGRRTLDLFAGTGALGLEALSRGAAGTVFVEKLPAALARIRANAARLDLNEGRAVFVCQDAARWLRGNAHERFDVVFADPPYRHAAGKQAWECLLGLVAPVCRGEDALVYCEGPSALDPDAGKWETVHAEAAGAAHWALLRPAAKGRLQ